MNESLYAQKDKKKESKSQVDICVGWGLSMRTHIKINHIWCGGFKSKECF